MLQSKLSSQEVSRDQLLQQANSCIETFCSDNQLESIRGDLAIEVSTMFAMLPERIRSKRILKIRCCTPASEAIERLSRETSTDQKILEELRQDIYSETIFLLDARYIESATGKIKEYCETHPCPSRWNLGSIRKWGSDDDKNWGMNFWMYWRNNIERNNDEKFQAKMLLQLPEVWRQKFKPNIFCPHNWGQLDDEQIAMVLENLRQRRDPAAYPWGLGSIEKWTGKSGEPWGQSFYGFLRRIVGEDMDDYFRARILPFFPPAWQTTYETKDQLDCPHKWREMNDKQIAMTLQTLKREFDPAKKRWGLGSIQCGWIGEKGQRWGRSFYMFWRRTVEPEGDALFSARIVPLLPLAWQKMYRMKGYKIDFLPSTEETKRTAEMCHDIDGLVRLVHEERNPDAFPKLVGILIQETDKKLLPHIAPVPVHVIERCVHNFIPTGDIIRYCVTTAYFRSFSAFPVGREARDTRRARSRTADYVREADHQNEKLVHDIDQKTAKLEDAFFSTAEYLDVAPEILSHLIELAKNGVTLQNVMFGKKYSSALQTAARAIWEILEEK